MAPQILDGATLGEKHQHYNKLARERSTKKQTLTEPNSGDGDIENLIKIDIANKNKDIDYLLEVFKSEDTLYLSRAIKQSTWLLNHEQYAHIINPKYLHDQLFPQMTSKAINKLLLNIRVNLKNEQLAEDFYKYEFDKNRDRALKWLPYCSVPFIERVAKSGIPLNDTLLKRLTFKSFSILENYIRAKPYFINEVVESNKLFLNVYTERFLNMIEPTPNDTGNIIHIEFGEKCTRSVMTKCRERIFNNFQRYAHMLHTKTFVKYIKREEILNFLIKHSKNKELCNYFDFENLKEFISRMPIEGRFEFVKELFINRKPKSDESAILANYISNCFANACSSENEYQWYQFAPFNIALPDLMILIRAESSPIQRNKMLGILITCAGRNMQHIETILQYYHETHINEPFKFKIGFINRILPRTIISSLNDKSWNILNELFHSMEVYIESNNNVQICIQAIILYKVTHGQDIPESIEKKFEFSTFKETQLKLQIGEKEAIFKYLHNLMLKKIDTQCLTSQSDCECMVILITNVLKLLIDWDKQLLDHPIIVDKIRELIKLKIKNSWKLDLSSIYNIKKSWRKHLFEESIIMCPSESVCVNALKHDPELLTRHENEVESIRTNDAVSLKQMHSKLRVYWPQSLAEKWTRAYLERLDKPDGHRTLIRGLCVLLSEKPLIEIIKKYAPQNSKISWNIDDEHTLSLQRYISKTMHIARPLIPIDAVLLYARGDYLQYAIPAVNAILYNLSCEKSRMEIPKFLNAPPSLQKFGIYYAVRKLKPEEMKSIFYKLWNLSQNPTIRTILFTHTYDVLSIEKDPTMKMELKNLICLFISSLTAHEDKKIYNKLSMVQRLPLDVRADLFVKSYFFLNSLPKKTNCESILQSLISYAPSIMNLLESEFVENELLKSFPEIFCTTEGDSFEMLASYLLYTSDEELQFERFRKILLPLIDTEVARELLQNNKIYQSNLNKLLEKLSSRLKNSLIETKSIVPVKMFINIQDKLENILKIHEHYELISFWKLTVSYVKLVDEFKSMLSLQPDSNLMSEDHPSDDADKKWKEMNAKLQALFADQCVDHLKQDVLKHFPTIYSLFGRALEAFFRNVHNDNPMLKYNIIHLILREDFIHSYLLVISIWPYYLPDKEQKAKMLEVRKLLSTHPSAEIKMHYHSKFRNDHHFDI